MQAQCWGPQYPAQPADRKGLTRPPPPPWTQPRGKSMVSLANSHANAIRIGWHLWEIEFRFGPGFPPWWLHDEMTMIVSDNQVVKKVPKGKTSVFLTIGTPLSSQPWWTHSPQGCCAFLTHRMYLSISFRKSTPPQNRHLIVYCNLLEYQIDGCVGDLSV